MSNQNINRRSASLSAKLSEGEKTLVELEKIAISKSPKSKLSRSLVIWYLNNQGWTPSQWNLIRSILAETKKKQKAKPSSKYYLYAIDNGCEVEVGRSTNPDNRIKPLQTRTGVTPVIVWKMYLGRDASKASQAEKKIRRVIISHHVVGKLYKRDCIPKVINFKPN